MTPAPIVAGNARGPVGGACDDASALRLTCLLLTWNAAAKAGPSLRSLFAAPEPAGLWYKVVGGNKNASKATPRLQQVPARPPPTSCRGIDLPGVDDEARSGTRRQHRGTAS